MTTVATCLAGACSLVSNHGHPRTLKHHMAPVLKRAAAAAAVSDCNDGDNDCIATTADYYLHPLLPTITYSYVLRPASTDY